MLQWVVVNGYVNLWVKTFPINFVTQAYKNWLKDTRQNLRFGEDIWKNRGIKKSVDMGSIRLPFRDNKIIKQTKVSYDNKERIAQNLFQLKLHKD